MNHFKFQVQDVVEQGRTNQQLIDTLVQWLQDNDMPKVPQETIVEFLLACNNDLEATKKTMQSCYNCKKNGPEIFDDRNVNNPNLELALKTIRLATMPTRTEQNYAVHYFKVHDPDYTKFDIVANIKLTLMLLEVTLEKDPPDGLVVVLDMDNIGLMHVTKLKLGFLRLFFEFLQEGMPLKLKQIHIFNTSFVYDKILALIKILMKKELAELIKAHPPNLDMEKFFQEELRKECIPKDYGGSLGTIEELHADTIAQMKERQEYFDEEERSRKNYRFESVELK